LIETPLARRFVLELLKSTVSDRAVSLDLLATYAACSKDYCSNLASELGIPMANGRLSLSRRTRLDLALGEARRGYLEKPSRFLDWQDFELFSQEFMDELGYETTLDTRIKGEGRTWQLDVIGIKGQLVICLDCKHWAPPLSPSRFEEAEIHQSKATGLLARKLAEERHHTVFALPMILTLHEPRHRIAGGVLTVGVQKLPTLLQEITPFSPDLPFMVAEGVEGENPISQSSQPREQ